MKVEPGRKRGYNANQEAKCLQKEVKFLQMFILKPGFKVQEVEKSQDFEGVPKGTDWGGIKEIKQSLFLPYVSHKMPNKLRLYWINAFQIKLYVLCEEKNWVRFISTDPTARRRGRGVRGILIHIYHKNKLQFAA